MLEIGYKHTVDIEAFNEWQIKNNHKEYNNAGKFFFDKICGNFRLVGIDSDYSAGFGEKAYTFVFDEEKNKTLRFWFWDGSIQFFTPIGECASDEMEMEAELEFEF